MSKANGSDRLDWVSEDAARRMAWSGCHLEMTHDIRKCWAVLLLQAPETHPAERPLRPFPRFPASLTPSSPWCPAPVSLFLCHSSACSFLAWKSVQTAFQYLVPQGSRHVPALDRVCPGRRSVLRESFRSPARSSPRQAPGHMCPRLRDEAWAPGPWLEGGIQLPSSPWRVRLLVPLQNTLAGHRVQGSRRSQSSRLSRLTVGFCWVSVYFVRVRVIPFCFK